MRILSGKAAERQVRKIASRQTEVASAERIARRIVEEIRKKGDLALRRYATRLDGLGLRQSLRVPEAEIEMAWAMAAPDLRNALKDAAARIRRLAARQMPRAWESTQAGITLGQLVRPIDAVGCYVPGGRFPLVSSVLMTVIPARVAGVPRIVLVSPRPRPQVLAAAGMLGVTEMYRVGGAQAIAALAYGTASIARVQKIVGPGNSFVTAAKKLVAFDCAIDFLAGPTEALIISHRGRAEFIAADLVAQAEHDPETLVIFVTTSKRLSANVKRSCEELARNNPIAPRALRQRGCILVARSRDEALEWADQIAPEHITVDEVDVGAICNAGSVFVGDYSAQAAGDYASGPNHVLPTGAGARFRGGLGVLDFVKIITLQKLSRRGLAGIARTVTTLAEAEGLAAHAHSVRTRCLDA